MLSTQEHNRNRYTCVDKANHQKLVKSSILTLDTVSYMNKSYKTRQISQSNQDTRDKGGFKNLNDNKKKGDAINKLDYTAEPALFLTTLELLSVILCSPLSNDVKVPCWMQSG